MSALDAVLAITILLNLTKGADLILREHQKVKLQASMERFAHWLEAFEPTRLFAPLRDSTASRIVFGLATLASITFFFLFAFRDPIFYYSLVSDQISLAQFTQLYQDARPLIVVLTVILMPLFTGALAIGVALAAAQDTAWRIVLHWVLYCVLVIFIGFPVFALLRLLGSIFADTQVFPTIVFLGAMVLPLLFYTLLLALLVCALLALRVARYPVLFCRGLAWRVVEYQKGAFAAIVLLVTVILGLIEIFAKKASG